LGAVVDVEEFEWAEDGVFFAVGTATFLTFGGHGGTRDDAEGVAMGLLENFRGDRAVRKFETALRASQHPTGHVSASPPRGHRSDESDPGKDARSDENLLRD